MTAEQTLRLRAQSSQTELDGRRGVVRISGATMAALGLSAWDAVTLVPAQGTGRITRAQVAAAPPGTHPFLLLIDAATLAGLGVADGADIDVGPAPRIDADRVLLRWTGAMSSPPTADIVRLAMLGTVVSRGDDVRLLSRDLTGPTRGAAAAVNRAVEWLNQAVTEMSARPAMDPVVRVLEVSPGDGALVTMGTVVAFDTGGATTTSATLGLADLESFPTVGAVTTGASDVPESPPEPVVPPPPPPGLDTQLRAMTEWLDLDFNHHELLDRLGSGRRLGVLVTGPAGSGKVSLVRAAAGAVAARTVHVWAPQLAALSADAAVARLREAGKQAASATPAVLLVEDVDAIAGTTRPSGSEGAVIAVLRDLVSDPRIAVVCTTSRPEACDQRLREPGLLEREIELPLYTRPQRQVALGVLTAGVPLAPDVDLADVAGRTPGFVLADLVSLVHEAGVRAAYRQRGSEVGVDEVAVPAEVTVAAEATVAAVDFAGALDVVRPTGAEGASLEVPNLTLDDVGDMAPVKAALTETVLWPLTHPDTFARLGIDPPRGILLYGPPGCGKTFLVRALAGSGQVTVLSIKGAEVLSKWVGESERGLREVFRRARQSAPALVFLDEIDALAPQRGGSSDAGVSDRVVAALLTELDGIDQMAGVSVIGATNRPDLIDSAVLRPGRLERLVFVPPPDGEARAAILRAAVKRSPLAPDVDLDVLGQRCEGFSAADCAALIREAALTAMRRSMDSAEITALDVEAALGVVRPSLDPFQVAALEAFAASRLAGPG